MEIIACKAYAASVVPGDKKMSILPALLRTWFASLADEDSEAGEVQRMIELSGMVGGVLDREDPA